MLKNLKHLFDSPKRLVVCIILQILLLLIWWYTTDIKIMLGNYGTVHTYSDIILSVIMIITFPIFIIALIYRSWKYWKRADIDWNSINWIIWWVVWTIISWASCCGATLAASFWLLPLMSLLPYSGLEIKILGAIGLLYALWEILVNLETCKIRK